MTVAVVLSGAAGLGAIQISRARRRRSPITGDAGELPTAG
jgi:hypothetical protein